ncbi:hypothetical protein F3Y22_tig00110239pilonHSYRG00270 [Hibiscus syriacus]|uniref:Uncharacterized protein n=1 Tax=Hibiscus syriacus TaxID=106335 RepID=A0A6A3B8K9_HIBSY|nr:hypothetical protein F3Y22_tig00110239pilonHSYRG00270 [Hibiscus syriacus]
MRSAVSVSKGVQQTGGGGFHSFMVRAMSFYCTSLGRLAKKLPNLIVLKVDVDELKLFPLFTNLWFCFITDWPTLIYLKGSNIVDTTVGSRKDEIEQKIAMHSAELDA